MADAVEQEVLKQIGDLELEQLMVIHGELGLPNVEEDKKVLPHVRKLILRHLSSDEVEQSPDQGLAHFLKIKEYMDGWKVVKEEPLSDVVRPASVVEKPTKADPTATPSTDLFTLTKALKKDFTLKGSIDFPGQKDKLTFSNLIHQINSVEKKGLHTETEICEEVIRCISPDIPLRSYLEGKCELTLASLRSILRAHFQEKDPTTLFNSLSN